jgi:23S rRNA pseudouridine955/2504/2580 synthase
MKKLIVNEKYNNKKLNSFLMDNFNGLSVNTFYKALRKKDIRINNIKTNENCTIHTGDEITVFILDEYLYKNINIPIIYEDENILIVNKPDRY